MSDIETVNKYFSQFTSLDAKKEHGTLTQIRKDAVERFHAKGMPGKNSEMWREADWERIIGNKNYVFSQTPEAYQPVENYFQCSVQEINTEMFAFLNGWYVHRNAPLTFFPNGVIAGSLQEAIKQFPDLILNYLKKKNDIENGLTELNLALFNDGFFVYIPENTKTVRPLQIVNIVKSEQNIFLQPRNLIIVGKNSSMKMIHCDESLECKETLINTVTNVFVEEGASFDYFKLENKDNHSTLINHLLIHQKEKSKVNTNTTIFNGGLVHNTIGVALDGKNAEVNTNGLYLADGNQNITNCLYINHKAPNCKSKQLYKGILDNEAKAHFVGHIFVDNKAQQTEAYQTNRNILLTDEAEILTKPFLEIYADDVKCSHGATVGQLNEDALFYLRARGICEQNARILLLHAFAKEVVDGINIEALNERTENLVRKRLTGEIISCQNCMQSCSKKDISFEIEMPEV